MGGGAFRAEGMCEGMQVASTVWSGSCHWFLPWSTPQDPLEALMKCRLPGLFTSVSDLLNPGQA